MRGMHPLTVECATLNGGSRPRHSQEAQAPLQDPHPGPTALSHTMNAAAARRASTHPAGHTPAQGAVHESGRVKDCGYDVMMYVASAANV